MCVYGKFSLYPLIKTYTCFMYALSFIYLPVYISVCNIVLQRQVKFLIRNIMISFAYEDFGSLFFLKKIFWKPIPNKFLSL